LAREVRLENRRDLLQRFQGHHDGGDGNVDRGLRKVDRARGRQGQGWRLALAARRGQSAREAARDLRHGSAANCRRARRHHRRARRPESSGGVLGRDGGAGRRRRRPLLAGLRVLRPVRELRRARPRVQGAGEGVEDRVKNLGRYDYLLFVPALALALTGLVIVYSASSTLAREKLGFEFYFLERHALYFSS